MQVGVEYFPGLAERTSIVVMHFRVLREPAEDLLIVFGPEALEQQLFVVAAAVQQPGVEELGHDVVGVQLQRPEQCSSGPGIALVVIEPPCLAYDESVAGRTGQRPGEGRVSVLDLIAALGEDALPHVGEAIGLFAFKLFGEEPGRRVGIAIAGPDQRLDAVEARVVVLTVAYGGGKPLDAGSR